jgi:reductive dehalogenase
VSMEPATVILMALGVLVLLGFGAFGVTSLREGERRAAGVALELSIVLAIPLFLATLLPQPFRWALLGTIVLAVVFFFLLPIGRVERDNEEPRTRIDERDIMFARARLEPGTPNYEAYYALHPKKRTSDDKSRSLPGILSPEASEVNQLIFDATDATFEYIERLHDAVNGPVASEQKAHQVGPGTGYIKGLARYWGARDVGVTELKPYHVYSHIGRGKGTYGAPITLDHRYAIAFTVEMDRQLVGTAPAASTILESARQYGSAAAIAVQLGNLIRSMGYPARAQINGNYRVVAPLVARDAGLGEIGRMGLLMTPELGPRVRLGVVTTDLPLLPDPAGYAPSVLDFCRVCKKCADNCPVRAIPTGDREEIDGVLRWRIDQEVCYRYWCVTGTDCARCMALCPYSYPDSPMHNMVRWAARNAGAARRAVIGLDRVFYGRAPAPKPVPSWLPSSSGGSRRDSAKKTRKAIESDIEQGEQHGTN